MDKYVYDCPISKNKAELLQEMKNPNPVFMGRNGEVVRINVSRLEWIELETELTAKYKCYSDD